MWLKYRDLFYNVTITFVLVSESRLIRKASRSAWKIVIMKTASSPKFYFFVFASRISEIIRA